VRSEEDPGRLWIHTPFVDALVRRKHVLSILVASYELGTMSTSQMIRSVRGHPAAVIDALGGLEGLGILSRRVSTKGRRSVEIRLTVKGLQLMDTPMNHWGRLIRKWGFL